MFFLFFVKNFSLGFLHKKGKKEEKLVLNKQLFLIIVIFYVFLIVKKKIPRGPKPTIN